MDNYLAFISYRHQKLDQNVSYLLRRYLESFHLPSSCPIPKRRKCFRDTDELPTSTDLGADIEHALQNSDYLIAVCSEEYVKSKWCMREIELYIQQGKKDRILPVLISGIPETSIPEQIRDIPPVLDLREAGRGKIREQIPQMLSRMSGTDASEIASTDSRFRVLSFAGIFGGLGIALLGVVLFALFTAQQIQNNNQQILLKTEEAKQSELDTEQKIYDLYEQQSHYIARQIQLKTRQGKDREALETSIYFMPWFFDSPSYAFALPDPTEATDALRMALAMPRRQRITYGPWATISTWEYTDYDQPEDIPYSLNGQFSVSSKRSDYGTAFLDSDFRLETTSEDGIYIDLSFDEYGWPELEEKQIDPDILAWGYSHIVPCPDGSRILYGKNSPMIRLSGDRSSEEMIYCVDGEPFEAEQLQTSPGACRYLLASDSIRTVLFLKDRPEAIAVLPVSGAFTCAAFNPSLEQLALIDSDGCLYTFLTRDGTQTGERKEAFRYITYANENYRLYAVTEDGSFQRLHALTLNTEVSFEVPRPVLCASYCAVTDTWLLISDNYAFIYTLDYDVGTVVDGYYITGEPVSCAWEGQDEAAYTHDGNGFLVICKDWINFYTADTSYDAQLSFPLVNESTTGRCIQALYSSDGNYVYLLYDNGDLFCWDLWLSDPFTWHCPSYISGDVQPDSVRLSRDGTSLWRSEENQGLFSLERVDAEYGYTISRLITYEEYDVSRIAESSDGWYALAHARNTDRMVLFDPETMEIYWTRDDMGYGIFSEYDSVILCLDVSPSHQLIFRSLDPESGKVQMEKTVGTLTGDGAEDIRMDQETLTAVVDDTWLVDLTTLKMKKLSAAQKEHTVTFAGQEAYIRQDNGRTILVNALDGHLILDAKNQQIAVSPAGDNIVLYGGDRAPYTINAMNTDDLMDYAITRVDLWDEVHDWEEEEIEEDGDL